ncbi:MAG: hypothetical protein H6910_06435 [Rickettsiaceae bacterium]|nr:hypothetical protein [Rickettsiaceae bacterium]MCP5378735.1 hypothetical protein [Rickettsiaceae bacterium]
MNKSKFSLDVESINETGNLSNKIDKEALQAFAKGALEHDASDKKISPWQNEDPYALPDYNFRLRLNKYQIGLLRHAAKIEKRSLSNMIKSILLNELEKYTK